MTKKLDSLHRLSDWAPRLAIGGGLAMGIALLCLAAPRQEPADSANGASSDRPVVHAVALQPPQLALVVSKSIENARVGQRVPSKNPSGEFDRSLGDEVDPPTWRRLELRAPKRDGTHADVVLLRPQWWLQQRAAEVGGTVYISVPECGIDGNAELLAVGPCPPVTPGEGRVVIGTFKHQSAAVIDVSVEGLEEPIGVTVNHPFWSDDRQDFVRADALHIGERLHGLTGSPRITAISPRGPPEPVYNLEVHGEHCYQVTTLGLVVHNTAPAGTCFDGFIRLGDFEDAARRGTRAVSSGGNAPRAKTRLYEVDTYNNLRKNPAHGVLTDTIAEHSPQKKWAQDLIADYSNRGWREPAIRVTVDEAAAITQAEKLTQVPASARDALAIKIRILRHHTNAPNSALHELIQLNKRLHRYDYDPLHRLRQ